MEDVIHVAPGIMFIDGTIKLCPGCGLEGLPMKAEATPYNVRAWCRAAVAALAESGARGCTPETAEEIAEAYISSPWHAHKESD